MGRDREPGTDRARSWEAFATSLCLLLRGLRLAGD